jgi:muramoyltetrapeptide carboxypeptidase
MRRRNFLKTGAVISAYPFTSYLAAERTKPPELKLEKIKPPRLKKGDTLGIIAPGSFIDESELEESVENLEDLGFKTYYTGNILERYGYLAGTDKQRVEDINHMFGNEQVAGIVCARGGWGCNRILPDIDYELIKNNPKVLVGYSDITSLLFGIYSRTGLVTFHGPVGISTFNDFSVGYLEKMIMDDTTGLELLPAEENLEKENDAYKIYTLSKGKAEGELIGGNLSIAASLVGTPYDVDYSNKLLYLEDIGEEPYRIDRMLTELILAGKLDKVNGIILGVFVDCEVKKNKPSFSESLTLKEVFIDRLAGLGVPVIYGMPFGHISSKFTLPFGSRAELDTEKQKIKMLESSVI